MSATDELLEAALRRDPSGPLLTFYDDATGERVELSATTLANWVAKTANLLQDDVGAVPGDRVAVLLPAHWQTAAVLLGAWATGAVVGTDPDGAVAAFTDADRAAGATGADEVFALALAPLGRGFDAGPPPAANAAAGTSPGRSAASRLPPGADAAPGIPPGRSAASRLPPGARDYVVEVRAHGDRFSPRSQVPVDAPALDDEGTLISFADLVGAARDRATDLGLAEHDRLLSAVPWAEPADWVEGLLAPLTAGATVVLCVNADPAGLPRRAEAEHATATLGVTVPGIRLLSR